MTPQDGCDKPESSMILQISYCEDAIKGLKQTRCAMEYSCRGNTERWKLGVSQIIIVLVSSQELFAQ